MNRITSRGTECGIFALLKRKQKSKQFYEERRKAIKETKLIKLRPLKPELWKIKTGPISKADKEHALRIFHMHLTEYGLKESKAVEKTAKILRRSKKMIRNILKEYNRYGSVKVGPHYRPNRKTYFDKLTIEERDLFRTVVHNEMKKCNKKDPLFEEDVKYPTVASIHTAIMKRMPGIQRWSKDTTYRVLRRLGFLNLENKDIHYGLLVEDTFTVARRGQVCLELLKLWAEGYYLIFEDESFINVQKTTRKKWHDTTVKTAKEAKARGLSTGNIKPPGRGERLILIGAGGIDGWEQKDVIDRSEGAGNDMEYKNDLKKAEKINMDSSRFEHFVHKTALTVTARHEKVAWVMDNASYHNQYREDIPRSDWSVARIKAFCKNHNLEVFAKKGKRGKPVKKDYMDAVNR